MPRKAWAWVVTAPVALGVLAAPIVTPAVASSTVPIKLTATTLLTLHAAQSFSLTESSVELLKGRLIGLTRGGAGLVEIQLHAGEPALVLPLGTVSGSISVPKGADVTLTAVVDGTAQIWVPAKTRWRLAKPRTRISSHLLVQSMTPATTSAAAIGYAANPLGGAKSSVVAAMLEWPAPPTVSTRSADACSGSEAVGPCDSTQGPETFSEDVQYISSHGQFGINRFVAGTTYARPSSDAYVRAEGIAAAVPPFTTALLVAYGQ